MIKEIIYNYFDKIRIEKESREKTGDNINFAPSYINKCKRQIFYQKTNTQASNPIETHSYIKFEMGDSIHLSIQNILKEIGIYKQGEDFKEIEWQNLKWIYRIDGLLEIDDIKHLIEIKTVYASGYNSIEKEPKEDHVLQLFLYMLFEKIDNGILLYIGRDNGFIVEYNFTLDSLKDKYYNQLIDKTVELIELEKQIKINELPEKDYQIQLKNKNGILSDNFTKDKIKYKTDWQCSYCSYRNLCHSKELEEIKNHKFYINGQFID